MTTIVKKIIIIWC